ncbi:mevalonate kinase [Streptococcus sciuri]|uniref:Mevalonate kinase n=1 Tax=Streptococcus sciuri TaxID=2973939 RepID=A0ABT2F4T5_9STRE|nr:mevalonate kinase [Streptococcus sciuri]MCS4487442.1 mevalonate kinase [Streptococcus sciuri]
MTKKIGLGKAHSKIILMGEHSVVYGYPAIALPLKNIEVVCQVTKGSHPLKLDVTDPLAMAIFAALEHLKKQEERLEFHIQSQVPKKRGMGSSAAVAIAAIRGVFDYFEEELSLETLEYLVNQAEMIAHTNPSGLDAKACLSEVAIKFIRNMGFSEVALNLDAHLLIADTGVYGHTSEAVEKVKQLGAQALPLLQQLGDLAEVAEKSISTGQLKELGESMFVAHEVLKRLGVSSSECDHLVSIAKSQGAIGAKMTGGGLGGCIIALVKSQEKADKLSSLLKKEGAVNIWMEKL